MTLTVLSLDSTMLSQRICRGSSYTYNGLPHTQAGTYRHVFKNRNNCDSIVKLELSVKDTSAYRYSMAICSGSSYYFKGLNRSIAGVYRDTLSNSESCDSFVTLYLSADTKLYDTLRVTLCQGQPFRGYSIAGVYTEAYTSVFNCDSLWTPILHYLPPMYFQTKVYDKCGASKYRNIVYRTSDSLVEIIKNALDCDSISTTTKINIT